MTSGNLFFKMTVRDIKRRIWYPVLLFVAYFLVMEIDLLLAFQQIEDKKNWWNTTCEAFFNEQFLSPVNNSLVIMVTVIAAVVCGLSSFLYLNDRKQIDLYHSLPIKRVTMFFCRYLSGILCFAIPFLFHFICFIFIASGRHALNSGSAGKLLGFLLFNFIYFISIYSVVIIAVMLTGNLVTNFLGACVLLLYSNIFWGAVQSMCNMFFNTFATDFFKPIVILSPLHDLFNARAKISNIADETNSLNYAVACKNYVIELIFIFVFIAIACFLYIKRPSEAAGKSIVFPVSEGIIKVLFILPVSLLCGFFFNDIYNSNQNSWFIFGCVFGFFFIGFLMEMIYRQNFKALFCHVKWLLCDFVLLIIIVAVFKFDLIGYDRYIPKEEQIDTMAVSIEDLDSYIDYVEDGTYMLSSAYRLNHMKLADFGAAYNLSNIAVENPIIPDDSYDYEVARQADYTDEEIEESDEWNVPLVVMYQLKNGKKVYRSYYVDGNDELVASLLNELYDNEDYKKVNFPIFSTDEKVYKSVDITTMFNYNTLKLKDDMSEEFLDIYKDELSKITLEEIRSDYPVCSLSFSKAMDKDVYSYSTSTYPVYPSFKKTIEWLKQNGCDVETEFENIKITSIQVVDYSKEFTNDQGWTEYAKVAYDDPEQIKQISDSIMFDMNLGNYNYMPMNNSYEVNVYVENTYGSDTRYCYFKKGTNIQFIKEDLDAYVPEIDNE